MQNQLKLTTKDIIKNIKDKIEYTEERLVKEHKNFTIKEIISHYTITNILKRFFTSNQLSQIMEETNPLAEITQKRKISSFGVGAIDKKKAKIKVREIHNSHYGRICPIETTEGKNTGLILSLAKDAKVNKHGFIETPFYLRIINSIRKQKYYNIGQKYKYFGTNMKYFKIDSEKVVKKKILINKGVFYISSDQERGLKLAPGDIFLNNNKVISTIKNKLDCIRSNQGFEINSVKNIKYISTSTNQIISIGTGLIPFLEHDDANRALMGSNMQRQALPLNKKETSLIETGIETQVGKESQSTIIVKKSGIIKYSSHRKIIVDTIEEKTSRKFNSSKLSKTKSYIKNLNNLTTNTLRKVYFLENPRKSNQNGYLKQNNLLNQGDWVKKGQVIADGSGTLYGKLSLGRNILIGYLSWEGYNFEDAIVINERLIKEDIFTSTHIKKYKSFVVCNKKGGVRIKS